MPNTIKIPIPGVEYARVDLPEIKIGDNPYAALESAAEDIATALAEPAAPSAPKSKSTTRALEEREAQDDAELLHKVGADLYHTAATYIDDSVRDSTAGPGLTSGLSIRLADRLKYWMSQTKKVKLHAAMEQSHAKVRLGALPMSINAEAVARASGAVEIADATIDRLAQIAFLDPDQIGAVRDEQARCARTCPTRTRCSRRERRPSMRPTCSA